MFIAMMVSSLLCTVALCAVLHVYGILLSDRCDVFTSALKAEAEYWAATPHTVEAYFDGLVVRTRRVAI